MIGVVTIGTNSPPVPIELPVRESEDLCPQVEDGMKQPVESNQPDDVIRDLKQ